MSIFHSPWLWVLCVGTPVVWKFSGMVIYYLAEHYTTVLGDLEQLGRPRTDGKFAGNAVVAGGRSVVVIVIMYARDVGLIFSLQHCGSLCCARTKRSL
jgi:hypothetical protein